MFSLNRMETGVYQYTESQQAGTLLLIDMWNLEQVKAFDKMLPVMSFSTYKPQV